MDSIECKRLRWRSRRGLLELDLILERFLAQRFHSLAQSQWVAYRQLLDLPDNDLLDIVSGKVDLDDGDLMGVVAILRAI